ncbi:MAG: MliC family protein [Reyranellales bacterium]|jgi:membrane-bound inhibitor of C-type lysozyme
MRQLSIAVVALAAPLAACVPQEVSTAWTPIPRPAPDDPAPQGIAYICDGRKEVSVVYAKNRASVTFDGKTWRMEYQATDQGFRYSDTANEWAGRDDLASLRESAANARPLAYNCRPTKRTS